MTVKHFNRDVEMMQTPSEWPAYPYLPLKHSRDTIHGWPRLGFLIAKQGFVVFAENMFGMPEQPGFPQTEEYSSAEEVFAAGWLVD